MEVNGWNHEVAYSVGVHCPLGGCGEWVGAFTGSPARPAPLLGWLLTVAEGRSRNLLDERGDYNGARWEGDSLGSRALLVL
jgi:hypothetical protein